MNQPHPAQVTPSWYGDSVGHYEGDTLVIDTVGIKIDGHWPWLIWYGTPHTEALHVVERYRLLDYEAAKEGLERDAKENIQSILIPFLQPDPGYRGKYLQLLFTVEDTRRLHDALVRVHNLWPPVGRMVGNCLRRKHPMVSWNERAQYRTRTSGGFLNSVDGGAMKLARRKFLHLAAGAAAPPALSRVAIAQTYPTRPITMIVPFAAGGPADAVARIIVERIRTSLGQPMLIENVTGADGSIGVGRASRAKPDGYTISFGITATHVLNGAFYSFPYDLLNDLAPVSPLVMTANFLFARETMTASGLPELIAWLKANPNRASIGVGAVNQRLLAALFQKETGAQFAIVPYRGLAPIMQDLVAEQIDLTFGTPVERQLMRAGTLKAYAVTSDKRWPVAPDIPTFVEMGLPLLSFGSWYGLFVPKGTPTDIISKVNAAAVTALADPLGQSRFTELDLRFSHASGRPRRRLPPCKKLMPRNGGRSSRSTGLRHSEVAGAISEKRHTP